MFEDKSFIMKSTKLFFLNILKLIKNICTILVYTAAVFYVKFEFIYLSSKQILIFEFFLQPMGVI